MQKEIKQAVIDLSKTAKRELYCLGFGNHTVSRMKEECYWIGYRDAINKVLSEMAALNGEGK